MLTLTCPAELDNLLVDQKNAIIAAIGSGQDEDHLRKAVGLFKFASPLWHACGYGYKCGEIYDRLHQAIEQQIKAEVEYLQVIRKNDKTRRSTEAMIARMEDLRNSI